MNRIKTPHDTYNREAGHVRRLRDALAIDQTFDPDVRAVLIVACDMFLQTLHACEDHVFTRQAVHRKVQQLLEAANPITKSAT